MFVEYPELMNINELMQCLKVGRNTAYALVKNETIKAVKVGTAWLIPKINVENYIRLSCGLPAKEAQ